MPAIAIREITAPAEIERAFAIRRRVFIEEQGVSEALEFDGLDEEARHLLASVDGAPAGTLRIRLLEGGRVAKIERVAVLAAQRRHRIGRALMEAALDLARAQGVARGEGACPDGRAGVLRRARLRRDRRRVRGGRHRPHRDAHVSGAEGHGGRSAGMGRR